MNCICGMPIELKMMIFFPIEFEGEADSVSVLHALVYVVEPIKIIEIFNI